MTCFISHSKVPFLVHIQAYNQGWQGTAAHHSHGPLSPRRAGELGARSLLGSRFRNGEASPLIPVSCIYVCCDITKIGEHFRALFHSKWDLMKCYSVNRSIIAPESENIMIKVILPMGSQGHFRDFMAAGRSQNIPSAIRASNKGRARVCRSWQLGNPYKDKLFRCSAFLFAGGRDTWDKSLRF